MQSWLTAFMAWRIRNWITAFAAAIATVLVIGIPTAMIKNPIFGRSVEVTAWSWPALIVTASLTGLLIGSYVVIDDPQISERELKIGGLGGILGFLAVGCPVCNKLALIALGSSGAMTYFAPAQPFLAVIGIALLAYALSVRLKTKSQCTISNHESSFSLRK